MIASELGELIAKDIHVKLSEGLMTVQYGNLTIRTELFLESDLRMSLDDFSERILLSVAAVIKAHKE